MDNNYPNRPNGSPQRPPRNDSPQRPRKRISKELARKRQIIALCVISLIVLIIVIVIAKACSKDKDDSSSSNSKVNTTVTTIVTNTSGPEMTAPPTTTTVVTTFNPDSSGFKMEKYTILLDIGQTETAWITEYPDGSGEEDERWSSSDDKIATVDAYGHITGVSAGECYITLQSAADPEQEVQIKVKVADPNGSIEQTSEKKEDTTESPQQLAEAPAPPVHDDIKGLTYKEGILLANKTYSMPEDFNPGLEPICEEYFKKLTEDAKKEGLDIYLGSGYRSYKDQVLVYNSYVETDGKEKADTYSARPGYSEHQTGLVIDVNTINDAFGETKEAAWLAEHAHEYGFIIRYPKGKENITGYKYEPWHIRYVGSKVATDIYERGISLEEYLNVDSKYPD